MAAAELFSGRWILVTGASSGIGEAIARVLAGRRANLVLTARRRDLLDALARECAGSHGVETRIVTGDLAAQGGGSRVAEAVLGLGLPIEHVVNNAGFGAVGRFAEADPARLAEMLRVNCEALTLLSRAFVGPMIERGSGGIMHVASVAGLQPIPYMAAYAATKAFVVSLSVALSEELRGTGVRAMALCPGPVPTGFQEVAGIRKPSAMRMAALSAEDVAKKAVAAYQAGHVVCVPGAMNRLSSLGAWLLPRTLATRAAASVMRRSGRG